VDPADIPVAQIQQLAALGATLSTDDHPAQSPPPEQPQAKPTKRPRDSKLYANIRSFFTSAPAPPPPSPPAAQSPAHRDQGSPPLPPRAPPH
jgi:hypothetical protein